METEKYSNSGESEGYKPLEPLQGQAEVNPNRKPTADELIQNLYKKRVPEPTFDQGKADRLQRMGKINLAGRGLSILGDVLATGLGAPVRRRQPDQLTPALYQSYQQNLDKYKFEKDQNILRNYEKDRQDMIYGIGRADRDEEIDFRDRRQTASEKLQALRYKIEQDKYNAGLSQKEREQAERERHNKEMEKSSMIRANKTGAGRGTTANKPFNPIEVKDEKGELRKMSEGEWTPIYNEALGDSQLATEFRNGNTKTADAMDKPQSDVYKKEIARDFYFYKQRREFLNRQNAIDRERATQNRQNSTGNDSIGHFQLPGLGKQKTGRPNIDYSKLNYGDQEGNAQSSPKKVPSFFLDGKPVTKPIF